MKNKKNRISEQIDQFYLKKLSRLVNNDQISDQYKWVNFLFEEYFFI